MSSAARTREQSLRSITSQQLQAVEESYRRDAAEAKASHEADLREMQARESALTAGLEQMQFEFSQSALLAHCAETRTAERDAESAAFAREAGYFITVPAWQAKTTGHLSTNISHRSG